MTNHDVTTGLGRLKQLRDDLVALSDMENKPIRFNMGIWKNDRNLCGTSACAMGYCGMQPWAKEQGLELKNGWCSTEGSFIPTYESREGFDAASSFFAISESDAWWMFDDQEYQNPDEDADDEDDYSPSIEDVIHRINIVIGKYE